VDKILRGIRLNIILIVIVIVISVGCTKNDSKNDFILSGESSDWSSELLITGNSKFQKLVLKASYKSDIQGLKENEQIEFDLHWDNKIIEKANEPTQIKTSMGSTFTLTENDIKNNEIILTFQRENLDISEEHVSEHAEIKLSIKWDEQEQTIWFQ